MASWNLATPQGMVLGNAVFSLWRALPRATADDAPALASGFLGLLNGLLSPRCIPAAAGTLDRANLEAMKTFLRQRLGNADLGVEDLLRAFHQSRASIYRLFQAEGGVRAFIQERRLLAVLCDLQAAGRRPRPIWRVALKWGFRDAAYFHRAFKRRFGVTPGEIVALGRKAAVSPATDCPCTGVAGNISDLHRWIGSSD